MDLFEYQARELFARAGVNVVDSEVAKTPAQAQEIAERLGWPVVLKAQVKVGGRGKAGGVKLAFNAQEAFDHAQNIFGMDIKGHTVHQVMVAAGVDIAKEFYFSILLDRSAREYLVLASAQGGMEIEELAKDNPDALARIPVSALETIEETIADNIVTQGRFPHELHTQLVETFQKLWQVFKTNDALLVEVNPLVVTKQGQVVALDGKVSIDDNALFRHPELQEYQDRSAVAALEAKAQENGLNYVKLDGQVGVIGNGAGLVMSTLDVVAGAGESHGGVKPANFLDIGGGASAQVMAAGLDVILHDPQVKSVFVNVFGGITACDEVANGIVKALEILGETAKKPLVVRLDGNNVEVGRQILQDANHPLVTLATTMDAGADEAARLAANAL